MDWELGFHGIIGDSMHIEQEKRQSILYDLQYHNNQFDHDSVKPFVFDVDLDCFTDEFDDITMAWPEKFFFEHYGKKNRSEFFRPLSIVKIFTNNYLS